MPGFVGVSDSRSISPLIELLDHEDWYETELVETDNAGLGLVHHGQKDPGGYTIWSGRQGAGVLYGAISNRQRLGLSVNELFEAIVNRPLAILPKLSGPFAVACYNARDGSLLAATDKLGTRDCYYAPTANGIAFGSELKTVLAQRNDVELDERAAADLLHFGHILGEKTLAEGVSALPPASLLQYTNGDLSVQRYWEPEFGQTPVDRYVEQTADAYRQTIADVAATMEGEVGLYLSGGLDSRLLAATLRDEYGPFRTLTYDGNPTDGSNPRLARRVAEQLEIENHVVDRTPGEFGPLVQKGMNITDGMISWEYFTNPNFVFNNLHDRVDLVLEGAPQGELFGEQIWLSDFQHSSSVTEVILRRLGDLSRETVTSLLNVSIDPADSVRAEVGKVDRREFQHRVMDVWLRNFCSNIHFRSSKLERSQAGTRIPFANTDLLNAVAQMPHQAYRRDTVPFSGMIPRSMAPLKRELILHRDELKDIPYERTSLPPARPLWLHDGMYLAKQMWRELAVGRPTPVADWSRDHAPMTQAINRWLDRAGERALFDEEAIRRIQCEHFRAEANHIRAIARITTLELWMEKYLDGGVQPRAERMTTD